MFSGGVLSWLVIMPLISMFAGDAVIFPGTVPISTLDSFGIWSNYVRYIGAGAVAAGGIISLVKSLPLIVSTFKQAMKSYSGNNGPEVQIRTDRDLNMKLVAAMVLVIILVIWLVPAIPVDIFGALIITVFGFFFATVASRIVGLVGSSNNPVSGMTIATLLIATVIFKAIGMTGQSGMTGAIAVGSIIAIIAAISGDTSQDLKTGYIVGSTPQKQQIGELLGVIISALAIGGILYLLNAAWGYGSAELPAPQAVLMKMVVEGVMDGNLPWTLVFIGAGIAVVVEILGIPVLPFAVGLYLPVHLNTAIMIGGLVRLFFEKKREVTEDQRKEFLNKGLLYTSGMIAGEGLVGILLAVFAVVPFGAGYLGDVLNISDRFSLGSAGSIVFFILLILSVFKFSIWNKDKKAVQ